MIQPTQSATSIPIPLTASGSMTTLRITQTLKNLKMEPTQSRTTLMAMIGTMGPKSTTKTVTVTEWQQVGNSTSSLTPKTLLIEWSIKTVMVTSTIANTSGIQTHEIQQVSQDKVNCAIPSQQIDSSLYGPNRPKFHH